MTEADPVALSDDRWGIDVSGEVKGSGAILRRASDGDLPFLRTLFAEERRKAFCLTRMPQTTVDVLLRQQFEAQRRSFRGRASAEVAIQFYIVVESAAAGGGRIGRFDIACGPSEIRVLDIALASAWRGRGIGSALLQRILSATDRSGRAVTLSVAVENHRARALYERLGFVTIRSEGMHHFLEHTVSRRPASAPAAPNPSLVQSPNFITTIR